VARAFRPRRLVRARDLLAPAGPPSPQYAATAACRVRVSRCLAPRRSLQNRLWGGAEPSQVGSIPIHPRQGLVQRTSTANLNLKPALRARRRPAGTELQRSSARTRRRGRWFGNCQRRACLLSSAIHRLAPQRDITHGSADDRRLLTPSPLALLWGTRQLGRGLEASGRTFVRMTLRQSYCLVPRAGLRLALGRSWRASRSSTVKGAASSCVRDPP
jgi:hypothetical protein